MEDVAVVVPIQGWARWNEVLDFADSEFISPAEAIVRLVNSGLSHLG